jgi:hypothetical protein
MSANRNLSKSFRQFFGLESIVAGHGMTEKFMKVALDELQKHYSKDNGILSKNQIVLFNAIENHRLHMIKCAKHMIKQKLVLCFNGNE